ncbi:VOC family protein [Herbaspirillum frisingense]|uniref:VOC family protein n=1 Tax=Herbaspirillum frisingense TaxID=92645 RepID=UPI00160380D6|nr:VOC family protein [Herbaspirillum frisingense]QNB08642.1 VOC family protein [Herbaspirillum frisingense]
MGTISPLAALAHVVMEVADVEASYKFYADMGLRAFGSFPGMAIIELRGGTHLLLFKKGDTQSSTLLESRIGQRPDFECEKIDLMIAGHTKTELQEYRDSLVAKGFSPSEIQDKTLYGHFYFSMLDLDGNGITFYTSHCDAQLP